MANTSFKDLLERYLQKQTDALDIKDLQDDAYRYIVSQPPRLPVGQNGHSVVVTIPPNQAVDKDSKWPVVMPGDFHGTVTMGPCEEKGQTCVHNFVDYVGFNDSFRYCTKCDIKER